MDDIDREFEQHKQAEKQRWFDSIIRLMGLLCQQKKTKRLITHSC